MKEQLEIKDLVNFQKEEIIAGLSRGPSPSVPDNGIDIRLSIVTSMLKSEINPIKYKLRSILVLYKVNKPIKGYDFDQLEEAITDYNKLLE